MIRLEQFFSLKTLSHEPFDYWSVQLLADHFVCLVEISVNKLSRPSIFEILFSVLYTGRQAVFGYVLYSCNKLWSYNAV